MSAILKNVMTAFLLIAVGTSIILPINTTAQEDTQAVLLLYHHISTTTPPVTSTSPEQFRAHLDYLADNGFSVLDLDHVINRIANGESLPDKTAVITFDDAYISIYQEAFPILRQHEWPFTIFVSTGLVGSNDKLYMTWEHLRDMAGNGALIANHTVSHLHMLERLPQEDQQQWLQRLENEITQAQDTIELEIVQPDTKYFAYPYGEYDNAIRDLVTQLGYVGIGQHSGPVGPGSDFAALPRFPFSGIYASMNTFPNKVNSLYFDLSLVEPLSPVTDEQSPAALLHVNRDGYRLGQLQCYNNGEAIRVEMIESSESFRVSTHISNSGRRFRYNCTAPGRNNRYHWYSIPFVNPAIPE